MTRPLSYPPVDGRRASRLRAELLRDAAALAPNWRGALEETGHDRALIEAATRLLEHSTRRLDKTPARDALAFLDTFDIPAPQPEAAEGVAVFALAEDETGLRDLPEGSGLEITDRLSGEPVRFETAADLPVHAARIGFLASVDPAADRIDVAPSQVTALEDDGVPDVAYRLEATAAAGDTVIRLDHAVGIEAGDLLRADPVARDGDVLYMTAAEVDEDGLVTLAEPLSAPGLSTDAVARVSRMTAFEAFAMPDRQEHALYLGDGEALDVSEPAEITLTVAPLQGLQHLTAHPFELEVWGLREAPDPADTAPRWHRLPMIGSEGGDLRFLKAWSGPIEEVEITKDLKSRWLRLRRIGPITAETAAAAPPLIDRIELRLETAAPEDAADSATVSQVAHNATPLPLPGFLPFGPEPRRFDTFALAAPETLSKKGARAHLTFDLLDATLSNMATAIRFDGQRHLYGVAENGRLQMIDIGSADQVWREARGPTAGGDTGQSPKLEPRFEPRAVELDLGHAGRAVDIVVVADTTGQLWAGQISFRRPGAAGGDVLIEGDWAALPDLPNAADPALAAFAALPLAPNPFVGSILLYANADGLHALAVDTEGRPFGSKWNAVTVLGTIELSARSRLFAVPGLSPSTLGRFIVTDRDGQLHLATYDGSTVSVEALDPGGGPIAVPEGQFPAARAWEDDGSTNLSIAWATEVAGAARLHYAAFDITAAPAVHLAALDGEIGLGVPLAGVRLGLIRGIDGAARPSVVASYPDPQGLIVFDWSPDGSETGPPLYQISPDALALRHSDGAATRTGPAALFDATDEAPPSAVLAGPNERLLEMAVNPSRRAEFFSWIATTMAPDNLDDHIVGFTLRAPGGALIPTVISAEAAGAESGAGPWLVGIPDPASLDRTRPLYLLEEQNDTDEGLVDTSLPNETRFTFVEDDLSHGMPSPGDILIVRIGGAGGSGAVFEVASVNVNSDTTLPSSVSLGDPEGFAAFAEGATDISFEIAVPDEVVAPGSAANYGTLALLEDAGAVPASISTPPTLGIARPAQDRSFGGELVVLLEPWPPDAAPPDRTMVKVQAAGAGPGEPPVAPQAFRPELLARDFQAPELAWEYNNGEGWKRLDEEFADETQNLSRGGVVSFVVPQDFSATDVGGQEDLWVRARLIGGDYGRPKYVITSDPPAGSPQTQSISIETGHMRPPEVGSVTAHFTDMPPRPPGKVIARNNLRDIDQSSANKVAGALWPVFEGAFQSPVGDGGGKTLLLGLTRPLPPGAVSLCLRARDTDPDAEIQLASLSADLTWSDASLATDDPTRGLNQSGLLTFSVSEPPARVSLLGQTAHWVRITADRADWAPEITGLWLNGAPILQAETIRQELLGGSLGQADLNLRLLKAPVLKDSLELRVREKLSGEEIDALMSEADPDAPPPVVSDLEDFPGHWVLWHQQTSLPAPGDGRDYLLAPDGTIRFGDGRTGRIPPAGPDAIRAFRYRVGGSRVSAVAMAEVKPRTQIRGFETAFLPEAVAGGTAPPSDERLIGRMSDALRHRNAGLTLADLEALARDADSKIVQVRADPARGPAGRIKVTVLARGEGRAPVYGRARRDALARSLARAASDAWPQDCIEVRSAEIVPIRVDVALTALPGMATKVNAAARKRLTLFLDAARGGPHGAGWPIGRRPWPIDLERALAGTEGLDRVDAVRITAADGSALATLGAGQVAALVSTDALHLDPREATA